MLKAILLAGAAMALVLSSAPSNAKDLKSIGVSLGSMGNPFFVALVKGAEFEAKKTNPNVKIMDGRFMEIQQAMGTPQGRDPAGANYLKSFVEEMKASGFVAEALKRSNQPDATVAPPAKP